MGAALPFRSFALFHGKRGVKRGDTVLVDHPEFGIIVRKVAAVSMSGRVALHGTAGSLPRSRELGSVDPACVIGKLILTMRWGRFLPGFTAPRSYPKACAEPSAPPPVAAPPVAAPSVCEAEDSGTNTCANPPRADQAAN